MAHFKIKLTKFAVGRKVACFSFVIKETVKIFNLTFASDFI